MTKHLLLVGALALTVWSGCMHSTRGTETQRAIDLAPVGTHLGPESELEAIRIATDFMERKHPTIDISRHAPGASYFLQSAIDDKPHWVVGFSVPTEIDGRLWFFTQDVWVREDGNVSLGPSHRP